MSDKRIAELTKKIIDAGLLVQGFGIILNSNSKITESSKKAGFEGNTLFTNHRIAHVHRMGIKERLILCAAVLFKKEKVNVIVKELEEL